MNKSDVEKLIQENRTSRKRRAVGRQINLWPKEIPYAIDGSLCKSYRAKNCDFKIELKNGI